MLHERNLTTVASRYCVHMKHNILCLYGNYDAEFYNLNAKRLDYYSILNYEIPEKGKFIVHLNIITIMEIRFMKIFVLGLSFLQYA